MISVWCPVKVCQQKINRLGLCTAAAAEWLGKLAEVGQDLAIVHSLRRTTCFPVSQL